MIGFLCIALVIVSTRGDSIVQSPRDKKINVAFRDSSIKKLQQLRNQHFHRRRIGASDDGTITRDLIIGGSLAGSQEYRSFAVTDPVINSGGLCGATLIYPDILISAAHCGVGGVFNNGVVMNIGATSIYGEDAIDRIEIVDQLIHPDYDPVSLINDVMLIKLSSPSSAPTSTWNTDQFIPENNESLTIIGHGRTESGSPSELLREATVYVVDDDICELAYDRSANSVIDSAVVLCAESNDSSTCSGDSGGPLFRGSLLVGVVSFGIVSEFDGSCISNFPSGFTRISAFSDFISQSLCTLSASPPESCFASVVVPVAAPTEVPISRPPTQPPAALVLTPFPTRTPTRVPIQVSLSSRPVTQIPTSLPPSFPPSLKYSANPSSSPSSNPASGQSYNPSPIPTHSSYLPSTDPTVLPTGVISFVPTSTPSAINGEKLSDENTGNISTAVTAIDGENKGFGLGLQSSAFRTTGMFDTSSFVILGLFLHGIGLTQL